jgi:hypothetical protein
MAANQALAAAGILGYPSVTYQNSSTLALNAAATWLAFSFVPQQGKNLSAVRLFLDTKTGSPTTAGCTAELYSDASGVPNASLEGPISATSVPASGNWMGWTFAGTSALTAGTQYWIVFKNSTATPASNFPTYRWHNGNAAASSIIPNFLSTNGASAAGPLYGWCKVHTVNSGAAWASTPNWGVGGLRIDYTDSTFDGMPVQTSLRPSSGTSTNRATGKQEIGVRFNLPANVTYNVIGIWFPAIKVGSPGNLKFRLYQGSTLLATTYDIPANNIPTSVGDGYAAYFSSAQAIISTNNPFRVTMVDATAADASTAGYDTMLYTWDSDSSSLTLKPMDGTLQKTKTTDNTASPPTFTDTSTDIIPFALILASSGEFTAAGGRGGGNLLGNGTLVAA